MTIFFLFWILFLVINFLFFLPQYVVNFQNTTFYPSSKHGYRNALDYVKMLYARSSDDLFRLCIDFTIVVFVLIVFRAHLGAGLIKIGLTVFCVCYFIYQIYYHSIKKIFVAEPLFYVDYNLIFTGTRVLFFGYRKYFLLLLMAIPLIIWGYFQLVSKFTDFLFALPFPIMNSIMLGGLFFAGFFVLIQQRKRNVIWAYYQAGFILVSYLMLFDIKQSIKTYRKVNRLIGEKKGRITTSADSLNLKKKPNIFFLFLESYGSVLYDDTFREKYYQLCKKLTNDLKKDDWSVYSNLSTSPRSGGGSWIVYTSFFYGIEIKEVGLFRALNNKKIQKYYDSFLHKLKKNEYHNYFLAPLTGFGKFNINWDEIAATFATHRFIKFEDIDYAGNFISGFGQQPPDQYSLNAAYDLVREEAKFPFSLFYLTLNSHAPWHTPVVIEDDYQKLNDANYNFPMTRPSSDKYEENYFAAVKYQLGVNIDFIKKQLSENDLIVLIGDHQPPLLTNEKSDYKTPIHIISKDKVLLSKLEEYGFEEGLYLINRENSVQHEGVHSIIERELVRHYGEPGQSLPTYLAEGIKL